MATKQDLPGVRTATSYGHSNNLGAEEPNVNSWARAQENGASKFHGCFEIKLGAERFITTAGEHTDRICRLCLLGPDLTFNKRGKKEKCAYSSIGARAREPTRWRFIGASEGRGGDVAI